MTEQLTTQEAVDQWAAEGEAGKILEDLVQRRFFHNDKALTLARMEQAVRVAGEKGMAKVIDLAFQRMLTTTVSLMMRVEYCVSQQVTEWDKELARRGSTIPPELSDRFLPALQALQGHVVDLSRAYATIQHGLKLGNAPQSTESGTVLRLVKETCKMEDEAAKALAGPRKTARA